MNVSVIIANYNKNILLKILLQSIFSQLQEGDEVIVIDDASTDNSVKLTREFDCKLIQNTENIGPASSRNNGVRESKNELLVFCDSDSCWEPETLSKIKNWFNDSDVVALSGNLSLEPISPTFCGFFYLLEEEENLHRAKVITGPTNYWSSTLGAIRKETFNEVDGFNETYKGADIEDLELGLRLREKGTLIFDKDLVFTHDYPSLSIMLKKVMNRTSQIISLDNSFKGNALIENNFRKIGYIISWSLLISVFIPKLFIPLVLIKLIHHRFFLMNALKRKGALFTIYSIFLMYIVGVFVFLGSVKGFIKGFLKS